MRIRIALVFMAMVFAAGAARAGPKVVTFLTGDGLEIEADHYATGVKGAPAVIGLHMYRSDRTAFARLAPMFVEKGMDFLAVDMRGHGKSRIQKGEDLGARVADRDPVLFNAMHLDALAAWKYLISCGIDADRVAFLGASVGCSVAVDAAGREERIRGAMLLTPGENYLGVPTMEHLELWGERPLAVLTSGEEADNGPRAVAAAVDQAELRVFSEYRGIHGTRMLGKVKGVESEIVGFFARILAAPVAMDGKLSEAESEGDGSTRTFRLDDFEVRVQARGEWLHVVLKPRGDAKLPERFLFAAAPMDGDPERARAIAVVKGRRGGSTQYLRPGNEGWMPVRRRMRRGAARVLEARDEVLELLLPHRGTAWLPYAAHLRLGFAVGGDSGGDWAPLTNMDPNSAKQWLAWPGR